MQKRELRASHSAYGPSSVCSSTAVQSPPRPHRPTAAFLIEACSAPGTAPPWGGFCSLGPPFSWVLTSILTSQAGLCLPTRELHLSTLITTKPGTMAITLLRAVSATWLGRNPPRKNTISVKSFQALLKCNPIT